ncbi:hypothetical protein Dda_2354 [Drechslerella dactyloides]|uniref:Uncharacterized protein n=1 Tax=Drechslerella dactyloides TaxID=74499 RepID=A0AAD6NNU1_DREDA|nr:hypothetical protein Dda_2354 [Drechslerella dactyloides]
MSNKSKAALLMERFGPATNLLLDHGITLIEWGSQVLQQHGYPEVICVFDFVVKDSQIEEAAKLLETQSTWRRVDPSLGDECKGTIGISGYYFANDTDPKRVPTPIHLLPESLVHLSSTGNDAYAVPSPFDPSHTLLRPKLPQLCVSLIKCLEDYLTNSSHQILPRRYLLALIVSAIYKDPDPGGKIWVPQEEGEEEESFHRRRAEAVKVIEGWEFDGPDEVYRTKLIKFLFTYTVD